MTYPLCILYSVNSYKFESFYGACVSRFPTSWAVEGSNDGSTWTMVDYMPDSYSMMGGNSINRSFFAKENFNTYHGIRGVNSTLFLISNVSGLCEIIFTSSLYISTSRSIAFDKKAIIHEPYEIFGSNNIDFSL